MSTTTRPRPRSLPSTTTKLNTEMGSLFVTVSTDEDGEPFEVFGFLGKGGSFQHGVTEPACRLISLHLRRAPRWPRSSTSARTFRRCSRSVRQEARRLRVPGMEPGQEWAGGEGSRHGGQRQNRV